MHADANFARTVHDDRRARLEGAAARHRLLASLRRRRRATPAPTAPAAAAQPPVTLAVVRPGEAAPDRTSGAAHRAA